MKEYNVILKRDVNYDEFWEDMETETDGLLYIPNRRIEFTNERPGSLRQCWYNLTDEEAELLRSDDRVLEVEIPPEHNENLKIGLRAVQTGNFTKTTSDSGNFINWGLIRSTARGNIYFDGTTTVRNYKYSLDGSGVDVVIQDSGIQGDHPEFEDANGNSRVQEIDWGVIHGGFTQNANHYRDYDGHGTHVAGIAAGKMYGWAKGARIYSQKIAGLEGTGDSGTGISPTFAFDAIKLWHRDKPIDPKTGVKRPTVVNMSWGYLDTYDSVTSVNYKGTSYSDTNTTTNASYRETTYGIQNISGVPYGATYACNIRYTSVDADIQEMLDAGIIVCIAAGNRGFKIDLPNGDNYNDYMVTNTGTLYYQRGSSPNDSDAFIVGNIDSTTFNAGADQKATSSEAGPGVNIWASGTSIMSCTSNTNRFTDAAYNFNSSFRQCNIGGTSMASPQVAGVAALVLQMNPSWRPEQVKEYLLNVSDEAIYSTNLTEDWSNSRSLLGSNQTVLFSPFKDEFAVKVRGLSNSNINIRIKQI